MRICAIAIAWLIVLNFARAQEFFHAFGTESYLERNYRNETNVHVGLHKQMGRHDVFAGIALPVSNRNSTTKQLALGYRFFPNKEQRNLDLFFCYYSSLSRLQLFYSSVDMGWGWQNTAGYGLRIRLPAGFYIHHDLSAGIMQSWFERHEEFIDPALRVTLGVGFIFETKK